MNLPGTRATVYVDIDDDDERAAWLLGLLDESADGRALVTVPRSTPADEILIIDAIRRGVDVVQRKRPDVALELLSPRAGGATSETAILVVLKAA